LAKQDIWEESELLIQAQVTGESAKPYTGTIDLTYIKNGKDDKPLATEAGLSLTDGKLEHKYKVPKVEPDEATYTLTVIATHGKNKESRSDVAEAEVWPKSVSIHTKTEKKPNEGKVPLALMQKDKASAQPITGDDGKITAELTEKTAYSVKSLSPYSIIKDEVDPKKLRVHEITVERNIVAMFVLPDVTKPPYELSDAGKADGGHRQFVNLTTAKEGQDALGNEVTFVVSANPKEDGRKDDPIYIQVTLGRESKRNTPKPELLAAGVSDLKNTANTGVYTGFVKLEADAGTAKFKVNLGLAGGDTCQVAIGGRKDTYTDATLSLVNWRKLFYELRYPAFLGAKLSATKDYPDGVKNSLTARLGKAFIVFEMFKSHEFPDADATIAKGNGTVIPSAFLKDTSGGNTYLVTNGILDTTGKFSDDASKKARSVYISLCDRAFSSNNKSHTIAPLVESADFDIKSPEDYVFEPSTKDGSPNLKVGSYKWKAVVANAHNQATTIIFETPDKPQTGGAVPGKVQIVETRRTGKTLDVAFAAKDTGFETALAAGETTKIDTFVAGLLSDVPGLREAGNQVAFKLIGEDSDPAAISRFTAVKGAIQAKFTSVNSSINFHPGLDKNGAVREGAMDLAWLSLKDYETIRVQLPKSPDGTAALQKILPGDFVGAAETDTTCKIQIKFDVSTAGSINGNSGGGEQIVVLKEATDGALSSTICHELGHAMGMTDVPGLKNDIAPPGLTVKHIDNGGTSYVNGNAPYAFTDGKRSIHKGGHCATGVPADKIADHKFRGWKPTTRVNGCIMWGSGGKADVRPSYCDTCLDIIKARRLDDIRKDWASRGASAG